MIEVKISSNQMESILRIYVNKAKEGEKPFFLLGKRKRERETKFFFLALVRKWENCSNSIKRFPT